MAGGKLVGGSCGEEKGTAIGLEGLNGGGWRQQGPGNGGGEHVDRTLATQAVPSLLLTAAWSK